MKHICGYCAFVDLENDDFPCRDCHQCSETLTSAEREALQLAAETFEEEDKEFRKEYETKQHLEE